MLKREGWRIYELVFFYKLVFRILNFLADENEKRDSEAFIGNIESLDQNEIIHVWVFDMHSTYVFEIKSRIYLYSLMHLIFLYLLLFVIICYYYLPSVLDF